jgi:AraC-like DNA-binding protein
MAALTEAWGSFSFSTDDLPRAARAAAVRELHEHTSLPSKIEPLEPLNNASVRVTIVKHALPGLGIMFGTLGGVRQAARPKGSSLGEDDDLLLAVNLCGTSIVRQDGHEITLHSGNAMLATRGPAGFSLTRPKATRFLGFRVPRGAIAPLVGRLDETPIQLVPGGDTLRLLINYANAIIQEAPLVGAALRHVAVTHLHDLIAVAVGATRDGRAIADGRGIAAARLRAVITDIIEHLDEFDLSVAGIAERQRVTPRYIHKLFEGEGLTFSEFVLNRRLACAHRLLSHPRQGYRTISSVAYEVGFSDLSHFNRAFRRRYGATPSEVRQSAMPIVLARSPSLRR